MFARWYIRRPLRRTVLVAVALLTLTSLAEAQTQASIRRGQEIAERVCSGCHAIYGPKRTTVEGTDVPSFAAIAGRPDRTAERLETFIMVPHRPMPAIPLERSEIRDVVAYILSLK